MNIMTMTHSIISYDIKFKEKIVQHCISKEIHNLIKWGKSSKMGFTLAIKCAQNT